MAAGTMAAGLVVTAFSTATGGQSPSAQLLFKPILPSYVLILHWSKQLPEPSQELVRLLESMGTGREIRSSL